MDELLDLAEREDDLVPEIVPFGARLSFTARAEVLVDLFSSVSDVAASKEILPNTSHALVEAFDSRNAVEVSATDGERSITVESAALVKLSGSALLPAKRMLDILRLARDAVRVDVIGTTATIRSGRAVWTVQTPPEGSYLPVFPEMEEFSRVEVRRQELLKALTQVLPAVSHTTARQALMQAEVAKGYILACDGVRAHKVFIPTLDKSFKATFPIRFIETAIKEIREDISDSVTLWSNDSAVGLGIRKTRLYSQRLNFEFPAVNHLVLGPALQNEEKLIVNRHDLESAIKRVRVNADPEYAALFLNVRESGTGWNLIVQARDRNGNASQEIIECEYVGPNNSKDLVVNHRFFLEFLACTAGGEIELRLGESTKTKKAPIYYESENFVGSLMVMSPNFVRS